MKKLVPRLKPDEAAWGTKIALGVQPAPRRSGSCSTAAARHGEVEQHSDVETEASLSRHGGSFISAQFASGFGLWSRKLYQYPSSGGASISATRLLPVQMQHGAFVALYAASRVSIERTTSGFAAATSVVSDGSASMS